MENNNLLVTGCAGYIGGTFAYEALKKGYNIIGIDNFSNSNSSIIKKLKDKFGEKFNFLHLDLLDDNLLDHLRDFAEINCVFHFAALKSVPESEKYPDQYFKNNVEGTKNLIKSINALNIKKLVFSSSAAVYGDQKIQPIAETANLSPQSVYAKTKKLSEEIIQIEVEKGALSATSLRYFNPLGSHKDSFVKENIENTSGNIMGMILKTAMGVNKTLCVYGNDYPTSDGTGERDYIHISDIIDGHFKAFERISKKVEHRVFNLGTGISVSVLELINTFEKVNKLKISYEIKERRKGDLARCFANPHKANEELNWQARYNLERMCRDSWIAQKNGLK